MGDCEGRMYPLSRLSFRNLSSSTCASGVKLYVLKDFGWNPSFSSILWSQGQDSETGLPCFRRRCPGSHDIPWEFALPVGCRPSFRPVLYTPPHILADSGGLGWTPLESAGVQ